MIEAVNRSWIVKRVMLLNLHQYVGLNAPYTQEATTWPVNNYPVTSNGPFTDVTLFQFFTETKISHTAQFIMPHKCSKSTKFDKKRIANSWKYGNPNLSNLTKKCIQEGKLALSYFHEFAIGFLWDFLDFLTSAR